MKPYLQTSFKEVDHYQPLIFNLGNQIHNHRLCVEEVGDFLPGSVMVQDLTRLTNTYMNQTGCDYLRHSKEELEALGPVYYERFFPPEEMEVIRTELFKFIRLNDPTKVYSFFQRVRPNQNTDYKWYLTSTRLYPQTTSDSGIKVMHIAIEVGNTYYAEKKMSYLCEQNDLVQKNYARYNLLTCREKEIIKLIVDGKSSYAISDMLFISQHTVNNHRKNIISKLQVKSLSELIKLAVAFNII